MATRFLLGLLLGGVMLGCEAGLTGAVAEDAAMTQAMRYYDGQRWRELWVNEHEVAEFVRPGPEGISRSAAPAVAATLLREGRGVRIWRLDPQGAGAVTLSRSLTPARRYSPVFHLSATGGARLALSGNIVVRFRPEWSEAQIQAWLTTQGLAQLRLLSGAPSPTYVLSVGSGLDALERANALQERGEVEYAMPEWWREVNKR